MPTMLSTGNGRTSVSRRRVLSGLGALAVTAATLGRRDAALAAPPSPITLTAAGGTAQLLDPPAPKTPIWGYDGKVPGPLLRVRQGEELWVRLANGLAEPTTIHWHGIRIDNRMDGVPHLTQDPAPSGGTFDYRFTCPDAGTFWYHPHMHAPEQVARGLYGVLIVDEREPPEVDRDIVLVVDDWPLLDDGRIDERRFNSLHDRAHAGTLGNVVSVNGEHFHEVPVRAGERIRLRLVSTATARVLKIAVGRRPAMLLAIDGQPVSPHVLSANEIELPPGGRADVMFDVADQPGSAVEISEVSVGPLAIARLRCHPSERVRSEPRAAPTALAANLLATLDLADPLPVDLAMTGGAMGTMTGAIYNGQHLPIRELARQHGQVWAMNGIAGMPDKPLFSAARGRTVGIKMVNDTRWRHALHIHGHYFKVVRRSQREPSPYWWDTVLMEPQEAMLMNFNADNPGKWMIHCHMLEHQAAGMMTWFVVEAG